MQMYSLLGLAVRPSTWIISWGLVLSLVRGTVKAGPTTAGFFNATFAKSTSGKANCIEGFVDVPVTATNNKILYSGPANNMAATELLVEIAQVDSNFSTVTSGGKSVISGTFSIYSKLCLPTHETATRNSSTLQFLTHGGTLDSSYWDIAPGYSYIDAAAAAGYATFSYDRLGSGRSDHPDPIQVVQLYLQIELAHVLVSWLKTAKLGGQFFSQIIGVGHSLGSGLTQAVTLKYPTDFSAVILTGHSAYFSSATIGTASTAQQIANTDPSGRFSSLGNAYLTPAPVPQSVQFAFYRYPYFDSQSTYMLIMSMIFLTAMQFSILSSTQDRQTH